MPKNMIAYVTSSDYKIEENSLFLKLGKLSNGDPVSDHFDFEYLRLQIPERLEVHLDKMVREEVKEAYANLRVPCIVEHAGLVFQDYHALSYPGGLTKPMWDTLTAQFIKETNSTNRRAIARAVVAYCDGKGIRTFVGETNGSLAPSPRGAREFYWDTVFIPDDLSGKAAGKTYAEIVADTSLGLEYKVQYLSQSTKAMKEFVEFVFAHPNTGLWG